LVLAFISTKWVIPFPICVERKQFKKKMEVFQVASEGAATQLEFIWKQIREPLIVPTLRWTVYLCLGLSLIMLVEKVYMAIIISYVKLFKRTPEKCYKFEAIEDDVELGNSNFPMVLVQVPMYNEREVNF